jgi:uncharacterized repeat protein (TIGR03803 family)
MDVSGNVTALYAFSGSDGSQPTGELIVGHNGNFYGTTYTGGSSNKGTAFMLTPSGSLSTLHSFNGSDGANPYAGLTQSTDGNLYGTTFFGGPTQPSGLGVVFRIGTPPVQLVSVVSRQTHGSAGTFDIDLTSGNGIECRSSASLGAGNYLIIFSFANNLASVGSASVTSGTGSVGSKSIDSTDAHNYIVNLTGATNARYITVSLANVSDSAGNFSSAVLASMGVLIGDTNADGFVNSADIAQTKSQSGQAVTSSNFREDVNADGFINSADISLVKSKSGTALP